MPQQNYEEYWKLTNAFTNYNGKKFLDTLIEQYNEFEVLPDVHVNGEYTLGENHIGKGATYSWTSENSGSGSMEILSLTGSTMETKIEFVGQGTSNGHWKFETIEDGVTKVTWGFSGEMPFMMRWMGARMDQWVGPDFETGLANLTELAEKETIAQEVAEQMTMQPVEPMAINVE